MSVRKCCSLVNFLSASQVGGSCQCTERIDAANVFAIGCLYKICFGNDIYNVLSSFDGHWTTESALNLQMVRAIV
jgi:hypothetical protein